MADAATEPGWWRKARCAGLPTSWFVATTPGALQRGVAICTECPVRSSCAAWGEHITTSGPFVVAGGEILGGRPPRRERSAPQP